MNKKCFYKDVTETYLNDIQCKDPIGILPRLHYGVLPVDEQKQYNFYDEESLWSMFSANRFCSAFDGIKLRKHYSSKKKKKTGCDMIDNYAISYYPKGDIYSHSMKWEDFDKITVFHKYKAYDDSCFTFNELSMKLPADEFIEWVKDNIMKMLEKSNNL